jgi:O-antigen/teichoic acid export membrane protein
MSSKMASPVLRLGILAMRVTGIAGKFLLGLFIAKLMSLSDLGIYGLLQGQVAILPIVFRLGLSRQVARAMTDATHAEQSQLIAGYFSLFVILYGLALAVAAALASIDAASVPWLAVAVIGLVAGEHLVMDSYDFLIQLRRPFAANVVLTVLSASWPILFMIAAYIVPDWRTINALSAFWLAGSVAAGIMGAWLLRAHLTTFYLPPLATIRRAVRASSMLYGNSLASTATVYLDRYLVGAFLSLELAGVYFFFWQVGNAIYNLVNSGLMSFARPHLVSAFQAGDEDAFRHLDNETTRSALLEAFVLAVGAAAVLWLVIPYLGRPLLSKYEGLLWLLLAAMLARIYAEMGALRLYCRSRDPLLMKSTLLSALLTAALLPAGIWAGGVYGCATALTAMYVLVAAYRAHDSYPVQAPSPQP